MPLRRRDARDRLTFELVESADADADLEDDSPAWGSAAGTTPVPRGSTAGASRSGAASLVDLDALGPGQGVPVPGPEDAPDPAEPADGAPSGGARASRSGRRTAVVGAVAAGVALVLGGMLAVDAWHGRADLDRLRAAPGGVEPLPDAPREQWTADVTLPGGFSLVPGALVTFEGESAVARSLDTGEERWRVEVGAYAACGSALVWSLPFGEPDDTLVCLAPSLDAAGAPLPEDELPVDPMTGRVEASAWTVTVVDADGEVLGRREVTSEGGAPSPGLGGTIVRAERVGEVPEGDGALVEQDPVTGEISEMPVGRPAVVRVEDALTGDLRWEADLPFVARSGQCVEWSETDGTQTTRAELENLWVAVETRLVRVDGCGVTSWFTPDGTRLDDVGVPTDGVVALGDGTYYRDPTSNDYSWGYPAGGDVTAAPAILAPDGSVRWEAPGPVVVPRSTDGRPSPRVVRDGLGIVAYDQAGAELWRTDEVGTPESVLVAASDTLVISNGYGNGVLIGLDAATGRERWSFGREEAEAALDVGSGWGTDTAYTDGTRAIVTVSDWDAGRTTLVALDLSDGHVAWTTEVSADGGSWAAPLQGRLLRMSETEIARLG
ncbi:hypothetical protein JOE63_000018 [Cellulosimicrobium cellulans]|uniref:outer membrane protein assembly factor BamB family protein n=1 Tax=Cellulosimicrobium cellulans TaxID=1710 RepID=UPI001959F895|nr:PQQ-binding-like beta-propeller repeat protein [Cellulosimicrobium cellulans]MBM7817541.1 hypothetical protein [Cellulosimicrobium cellulans]